MRSDRETEILEPTAAALAPAWWVAAAATLLAALLHVAHDLPRWVTDSADYLMLAQGRIAEVVVPFTSRILVPTLVGLLTRTGLSHEQGFVVTSCLAAGLLAFSLASLMRGRIGAWALLPFLLLPMTVEWFTTVYMPDFPHMALLALVLLLVQRDRWIAAALVMGISMMVRESTLMLAGVFVLVALIEGRGRAAIAAIAAVAAGMLAVELLKRGAPGNIHQMDSALYMVLKFGSNLLQNVFGIMIWTNAFSWCDTPVIVADVSRLDLGNIQTMGFCAIEIERPLRTFGSMAVLFGTAPGLLLGLIDRPERMHARLGAAGLIALGYGFAMLLFAPFSGKAIVRLTYYAWPFAVIALPLLLAAWSGWRSRGHATLLATLQVVVAWGGYLLIRDGGTTALAAALALGLLGNLAAFLTVMRCRRAVPLSPTTRPRAASRSFEVQMPRISPEFT